MLTNFGRAAVIGVQDKNSPSELKNRKLVYPGIITIFNDKLEELKRL